MYDNSSSLITYESSNNLSLGTFYNLFGVANLYMPKRPEFDLNFRLSAH